MIFHLSVQDHPRCQQVCGSFVSGTKQFSNCSISRACNQAIYIQSAAVRLLNFQSTHSPLLCRRRRWLYLQGRFQTLSMHFVPPTPFHFSLSLCLLLILPGCFQKSRTIVRLHTLFAVPFETSETLHANSPGQNKDPHHCRQKHVARAYHQNIHSSCLSGSE